MVNATKKFTNWREVHHQNGAPLFLGNPLTDLSIKFVLCELCIPFTPSEEDEKSMTEAKKILKNDGKCSKEDMPAISYIAGIVCNRPTFDGTIEDAISLVKEKFCKQKKRASKFCR